MTGLLHTTVQDRVAVLTLDDPARRNAMSVELAGAIGEALDAFEADDGVGAIVITGAPPAFCAGADLSELGSAHREGLRRIYEGFLRIGRSPLPSIAAVNGPAVGAGLNLALVCDLRLAARSARFDSRFLSLGLHPGGGHTWMLRHLVGSEAQAALVLFGEVLDGEAAVRRGLAWQCVEDDQLLAAARRLAIRAAQVPPALLQDTKDTLRDMTAIHDHSAAVERELEPQVRSLTQPEFAERLARLQQRLGQRRDG
jgi:enoyl-CoA hydratase